MIYRSRITSILLAILIAANQLIAFAGQNQKEASGQEESVKLKAVLIDVRAVVTDKNGRLVDNLTKDDFELSENDARQQIAFFSLERIAGKNHPDYTARAQKGYLPFSESKSARQPDPTNRLFAAMAEPLPHRQLDLSASAEFLERPADDAQVTLRIWR